MNVIKHRFLYFKIDSFWKFLFEFMYETQTFGFH